MTQDLDQGNLTKILLTRMSLGSARTTALLVEFIGGVTSRRLFVPLQQGTSSEDYDLRKLWVRFDKFTICLETLKLKQLNFCTVGCVMQPSMSEAIRIGSSLFTATICTAEWKERLIVLLLIADDEIVSIVRDVLRLQM